MKKLISLLLLVAIANITFAQDYFEKKGIVIKGYDVTEYFNDNPPVKGKKRHHVTHEGGTFYFASKANKEKFIANPDKYIPQYGGYCAYAIGTKAKKVGINPKTYEIRDGKLYLFYNSMGINTLDLWIKENPEELRDKADLNWEKMSANK